MELARPSALLLVGLVVLMLLLSRRRRRRGRQLVSALHVWRAVLGPEAARAGAPERRRDALTLLRAAFMLAAIGAIAGPTLVRRAPRSAFVLDVSASMSARDAAGTRLDAAKARAVLAAAALPRETLVRLVAAGSVPVDLGAFAAASPGLRQAIERVRPSAGRAAIGEALEMARAGDQPATLHVFSDGAPAAGAEDSGASYVRVGRAADNVAVTRLAVRRSAAGARALVEVSNLGGNEREVPLRVTHDRGQREESLRLGPGEARSILVDGVAGIVHAKAFVDDALPVDDERWAVAPSATPVRVHLVGSRSAFLAKALAANPEIALSTGPRDTRSAGADAEVVVCEGDCPLPAGFRGVLRIAPGGPAATGPEALRLTAPSHPVARALDLAGTSAVATAVASPTDGTLIVRAGSAPVVVAREGAAGRTLDIHIDLDASTLPLRTGFPVLLANAVRWLAGRDVEARELFGGEPILLPRGEGGRSGGLTVTAPDGSVVAVPRTAAAFTDTAAVGPYRVRGAAFERVFLLNVPPAESDLRAEPGSTAVAAPAAPRRAFRLDATPALIGLAVALLALEWWVAFRALPWVWWRRRRAARAGVGPLLSRALVAALLVVAAVDPRLPVGESRRAVAFLVDRSDSVAAREREAVGRVNAMLAEARPTDLAAVVALGSRSVVERGLAAARRVDAIASQVPGNGTDIAAALRIARALLTGADAEGRIVLVSDGWETTGDAGREATLAAAAGLRIDALPLDAGATTVRVAAVHAPPDARQHEPFVLAVDVAGPPGVRATVVLLRDGRPASGRPVLLARDGGAEIAFVEEAAEPGLHSYTASVKAPGDALSEAPAGAVVSVSGQPALLHVRGKGEAPRSFFERLGFRVTSIPAADLPRSPAGLSLFDAVVLDDVPADALGSAQAAALRAHVEDAGGGLLVLGGPGSLVPSGDASDPLSALLPIDLRLRSGRRAEAAALAIVFDKSGSMADRARGVPKIELARQAVLRVLAVLPATDAVGVVAFDSAPLPVVPFGTTRDERAVASRLRGVEPGGATAIAPALGMALDWLNAAETRDRQVLLVTDGRTPPADAERLGALLDGTRVRLSVVAIGADADRELLTRIATKTGGRAYFPEDARELPLLLAREATRSAGRRAVDESFTPRAAPHPMLAGLDLRGLPRLGGYVASTARPGSDAVLRSHLDDPVLAAWQAGLGRVAVYTAGLGSPWSAALRAWSGSMSLWQRCLHWLSRPVTGPSWRAGLVEEGGAARLVIEAEAGELGQGLEARASARTPGGATEEVALRETAPGRYEGAVAAASDGAWRVALRMRSREGVEVRALRGFHFVAARERAAAGVNRALLARLVEATGGSLLDAGEGPFAGPRPRRSVSLQLALLAAALIVFFLEIVLGPSLADAWWRWRRRRDVARVHGTEVPA